MSDQSASAQPAEKDYAFTVALTVYSALKQLSKGKSVAKRQEKTVKTKQLAFSLNEGNYIEFLESILEKHGQTQFKVSRKQFFSFKFTMPKMKKYMPKVFSVAVKPSQFFSQHTASEAMDVDNESDYKEMVQKIRDGVSDPGTMPTKISVDMKQVEKLPSNQLNSKDEELSVSDDNQVFFFYHSLNNF
ncbi:hypothetical protein JVT61DRAFT_14660 [Boletus reticuloceps]|uniref:Uncharacterized protein n=1 Tax=Boletus reticuloceps TaxID=495285 RepID=A0A8I2YRC2_9AGAM|nr:hypothetical protein JVT61DRAFT_14660 [Boletus reticuloceps]